LGRLFGGSCRISVEGFVAAVSGSTLILNVGGNDGVQVGDRFEISRVVEEVHDPVSKEVIDRVLERAGDLVITSVRDKTSTGTYSGAPAQVKYVARKN
jgi:hypothetical protein